jgi:transcriptional regulator with XRE-family HTH domain
MGRRPLNAEERAFGAAIGQVIAQRRTSANVTGQALASLAGVSVDGLRKLETGRVPDPGFRTVIRIADSLGLSLDQLARQASEAAQ